MPAETYHVPPLFYVAAAVAVFYLAYNLRRAFAFRIGKPESRLPRWWEIPRNLLVYGVAQGRVQNRRFGYASVMHALLGWGFIELFFATTVDFLTARGIGLAVLPGKDTPWFAFLNELGGLALVAGSAMALIRRHSRLKPEHLPQDSFSGRGHLLGDSGILIVLLLLALGGFLAEAARLAVEMPQTATASFVAYGVARLIPISSWEAWQPFLWWSHAILALAFIALIPRTKIFHSLLVIANAGATNLKERGQLRPMHLAKLMADPEAMPDDLSLGAQNITDLSWKQLLDAQSCTECARCTTVCPANVAGLPLSPMKIMQDIRTELYTPNGAAGGNGTPLSGGVISTTELWACTTCRACMDACPVLIDHVPTIVDLRRYLVLSEGKPPRDAATTLEKTTQHGNPWGLPRTQRLKWAEDAGLDIPVMAQKKSAHVLYWVGCAGAYDPRNQDVARAMIAILESAGIDYAVLGTEESCTGDSARRLGEEYVFETLAQQNMALLDRYTFDRIVVTCPHCLQTLGRDYAQLGGKYEVIHHATFIQELLDKGDLKVRALEDGNLTFHDPCYLGRHGGQYDPPREILSALLAGEKSVVEMEQSREASFCCGAGGGNMWHELKGDQDRMNLQRFDQATATGASTVATACAFCTIQLDDAVKVRGREDSIQIRDIAELVAQQLEKP